MSASQSETGMRILNAACAGTGARRSPSELALELQRNMLRLKGKFMSSDGKGVDYSALVKSEMFSQYQQLAAELIDCDVSALTQQEKKAFFINVYNALTIHGLAVVEQLPASVLEISRFWQTTAYIIGGLEYSLDDIEHGVLRGNRPHPSASEPPFSESDPRRKFAMDSCDPRVHFSLVCGSKSCPAIQVYSPASLDRALTAAASTFCSQEVHVDGDNRKVFLNKIFKWYGADFATSETELLRWLCQYLPEGEKTALQQLLSNQSQPIEVETTEYNWLLNKL